MSITTTITHDGPEGTEMTEAKTLPGKVFLRVPQDEAGRYEWLLARTERLLPEVAELIGRWHVALPATLEIVLTTGKQMARELAANELGGEGAGARGRIRTAIARRGWRGLEAAIWDWPSHEVPGSRQVTVYIDVASAAATREVEWGALLAQQVMLAALTAAPGRSRHLSGDITELVDTRQAPAARKDLLHARIELEHAAGQAAAEAWYRKYGRIPVLLARSGNVLELLDAEAADKPEVLIADYYTANEPGPGTIADVHDILSWNRGDRTTSYPTGLPIRAERARRLRAAAFADLIALQAEAEGSAEHGPFANTAAHLGLDLRDFDAAHETGQGWRGPRDLYWEASGLARAYTRQEWLASGCIDVGQEAED